MLENLIFSYVTSENQNGLFTPNHKKYDITITKADGDGCLKFTYQCNPRFNTPTLEDCLGCYIRDGQSYADCETVDDFMCDFGYEEYQEAKRIFAECKKAYENLSKFFTDEEQIKIADELYMY